MTVTHGFGLGKGTSAEGWLFEAIRFWETSIGRHSSLSRELWDVDARAAPQAAGGEK